VNPIATPAGWSIEPGRTGEIAAWLDTCESNLVHPGAVEEQMRRDGWAPSQAQVTASTYRRRFNEHVLGYSALLVTTGVAALAAGTSGHLLTAAFDGPVSRNALAGWLTALVVAAPFAIWAHRWAASVDRDDPVAAWSRPRHVLALILVWACGVVGTTRLVVYTARLIGGLVGATWADGGSLWGGGINVLITLAISLPLGLWAFGFLHRFDGEDPTVPPSQRQRADAEPSC
jgi:hypothetical protein